MPDAPGFDVLAAVGPPAVNESEVNADLPPSPVALVLLAVASLCLGPSRLVVRSVVLGAVASVCHLDAVGLGAVALHGHAHSPPLTRGRVGLCAPSRPHRLRCPVANAPPLAGLCKCGAVAHSFTVAAIVCRGPLPVLRYARGRQRIPRVALTIFLRCR